MDTASNAPPASPAQAIPLTEQASQVLHTDVAIVGGGLAGSLAAAMLGRQGLRVLLVDPDEVYPPDLRCEKISGRQVAMLRQSRVLDDVLSVATPYKQFWVARFGRVIEKRREDQYGIAYDTLVNRVRRSIPKAVVKITSKVKAVTCSDDQQTLSLATGQQVQARLVILATGLNDGLRRSLGITREVLSKTHSVTLGFDLQPVGRAHFDFPAMTYYGERPTDRVAYITLFPIGKAMRANLMVYRPVDDPCVRTMRAQPDACLAAFLPGLASLVGPARVVGPVQVRAMDLQQSQGYLRAGLVLVGDAFGTACPAAGTGTDKVYTDVIQLCTEHVPKWLQTAGMGVDKITNFYDDPVKAACDRRSLKAAFKLRAVSVNEGLVWWIRRWSRFAAHWAFASIKQMRARGAVRT